MSLKSEYSTDYIKAQIEEKINDDLSLTVELASDEVFYKATALVITDILMQMRRRFSIMQNSTAQKRVYYLCMEFLMGRSLKNSLYNLGIVDQVTEALKSFGVKVEKVYDCEPDAGLGNGGLGRLAACYLDALATEEFGGMGYSILYEYGIFKQKIVDGWQTEIPDNWLPGGHIWLTQKPDRAVTVRLGGRVEERWENDYHYVNHVDYYSVIAVPYDMYVSGYDSRGVSVLRLWKAKSAGFDMDLFNNGDYMNAAVQNTMAESISKVLYPNDNHSEGKLLRLKQQYFLAAASISDIVRRHTSIYGNMDNFHEKNAIHINDTHPTLAIPELMRIMLDDCGYDWVKAWEIVSKTFAYTNHTVMSEALERWNEDLFKGLLPRIHDIICEMDRRFCQTLWDSGKVDDYRVGRMRIINEHTVRMANLCVIACHSVNGVSKLHSDIIKQDVFQDYYRLAPSKFKNVTNGIASRRWLYQSNPGLTQLLKETIGDGFLKNMSELEKFKAFEKDKQVLERLASVKLENKKRFAEHVKSATGISLNVNSIFDVQVKRLHEYKRQHLNTLHIISLYRYLKENPNANFTPRTFIFGAKAAPGYYLAKQIIKLICTLRDTIEKDPAIRDKLRIVYLEDYKVTTSELLMPASEISEQISLAGTEASGTGNMKLMLNGAITLGTLDGANVEIGEAVGSDNILIFGMTTPLVNQRKQFGYNPGDYYHGNNEIHDSIDMLTDGIGDISFHDIANSLRYSDPFMVLADYDSYKLIQQRASKLYEQPMVWNKMSLNNIAASGLFCADRAILEYAKNIWHC